MKNNNIVSCILIVLFSLSGCKKTLPPLYKVTDLGTLGGKKSYADAINDLGQVLGSSETKDGNGSVFLWDHMAGMVNLSAIVGNYIDDWHINNSGLIAGTAKGTNDILYAL